MLQPKLLRAVQERTIERLGSNTPVTVDLRLITATSKNREQAVGRCEFREDLHFLNRANRAYSITPAGLATLCEHNWHGNVRELENTIARALVLARDNIVDRQDILLLDENRPLSGTTHWTSLAPLHGG